MLSVRRTRGHIPDTSAVRATHRDVSRRLPTQPPARDTIPSGDEIPARRARSLSEQARQRPPLHKEGVIGSSRTTANHDPPGRLGALHIARLNAPPNKRRERSADRWVVPRTLAMRVATRISRAAPTWFRARVTGTERSIASFSRFATSGWDRIGQAKCRKSSGVRKAVISSISPPGRVSTLTPCGVKAPVCSSQVWPAEGKLRVRAVGSRR
jgi:hypothetical protein